MGKWVMFDCCSCLLRPSAVPAVSKDEPMLTPPSPRDGWRIIATDDNTSRLSAIVHTLRDAGHCVFAAYDGRSAYELVSQLPNIDLLITNTRLGAVDGPELMRRSRALRPKMPILHVIKAGDSGDGTPPDVLTLREPFTPNQLLMALGILMS
jgi:CheY-like chemotaxis protein